MNLPGQNGRRPSMSRNLWLESQSSVSAKVLEIRCGAIPARCAAGAAADGGHPKYLSQKRIGTGGISSSDICSETTSAYLQSNVIKYDYFHGHKRPVFQL